MFTVYYREISGGRGDRILAEMIRGGLLGEGK